MDKDVWSNVVAAINEACREVEPRVRRPQYSDCLIVKMFLWGVMHDRPLCWSACRSSYGAIFRPRKLPSNSQFCRRVAEARTQTIIKIASLLLAQRLHRGAVVRLDGKPLTMSKWTLDKDAKRGWGVGEMQQGYKLHAAVAEEGQILSYYICPLNESEPRVAHEHLIDAAVRPGDLVIADANYDSRRLHRQISSIGGQLITPLKNGPPTAPSCRKQPPSRQKLIFLATRQKAEHRRLLRMRNRIESTFGTLSCTSGLLGPLQAWVRTLDRVRRWVAAKITLYHARLCVQKHRSVTS